MSRSGWSALWVMIGLVLFGTTSATASEHPAPPPANVDFDYQLGGNSDPGASVGVVVRDRNAEPSPTDYNICYVNAFQTQPDEKRIWKRHRSLVLRSGGRPVVDEVWGEKILDIRTGVKRKALSRIVGKWIDGCARHGYRAVEFDNLDSYLRSEGLIKKRQTKKYAAKLVRRAHDAGLAAGQKNRAEWDGRVVGFDFAIAEECGRWNECGALHAQLWRSRVRHRVPPPGLQRNLSYPRRPTERRTPRPRSEPTRSPRLVLTRARRTGGR